MFINALILRPNDGSILEGIEIPQFQSYVIDDHVMGSILEGIEILLLSEQVGQGSPAEAS